MVSQPKRTALRSRIHPQHRAITTDVWLLCPILVVALSLGATGLAHGLPDFPEYDEPRFVTVANRIANKHSPNPGWFGHPGSTLVYPLALVYKLWGNITYRIPIWRPNPELFALLREDPSSSEHFMGTGWAIYYLLGRWLNLFFFMGGIVVTYLLGIQAYDRRVGLTAAWFMAVTPILVQLAQIVRTDHVSLLTSMLACGACLRLFTSRKWHNYAIAGLAVGIACSSKYPNLSLGAMLIVVHILSDAPPERGRWKPLIVGLIAIALGFVITTPASVMRPTKVLHALSTEAGDAFIGLAYPAKLWWYLSYALPNAFTWPIWLLALAGACVDWRKRNKKAIALWLGASIYFLSITVPPRYWQRWLVPVLPIGLLSASKMLWSGIGLLADRRHRLTRWKTPVAISIILAFSVVPVVNSVKHVCTRTLPNTKSLAAQWLGAHVPPGSRIAREWYTPMVPRYDVEVTWSRYLYQLGPLDETLTDRYDYLVTSSDAHKQFFRLADQYPERVERYRVPVDFYRALLEMEPVAEFLADPRTATGPTIRVYAVSTSE